MQPTDACPPTPPACGCPCPPPSVPLRLLQLPQWVPLSVVKGGTAANLLVKGLETEFMRETTINTLVQVRGLGVGLWVVVGSGTDR